MQKNKDDNFLKKELDKGNNFIDYFIIIGLSQDTIFQSFLYENTLEVINDSELISPVILTKFPPYEKTTINMDESIIKHCFPNGYRIIESQKQPQPENFTIMLDNNYYTINFPQKYMSCLVVYESLATYKKLYDRYKTFDEHTDEILYCDLNKSSDFNIRTTMGYSTNKNYESVTFTDPGINSLRHTMGLGIKSKLTESSNYNKYVHDPAENRLKNLYAPKCILLASLYPFLTECSKILKKIYSYSKNQKLKKPLEKVIENLVIEVPVPPRGLYSVTYQLFNEKFVLTQTPMNQLPTPNIEIEKIFQFFNLDLELILNIYRHILLETKMIFFSSDISKLTPLLQGFLSLAYPFKYTFQFVTILPEEHFNIIECVAPYIFGVNKKFDDGFFDRYNIDISDMVIFVVDIDEAKTEVISPVLTDKRVSVNNRNKYLADEFPELPKHYKQKLIDALNTYLDKIKSNKVKEDSSKFSNYIRNIFFQFIVNILQNYNKHLNIDYYTSKDIKNHSVMTLFKDQDFIQSFKKCDQPFYNKFKSTQMFFDYILKRMIPKDSSEKLDILLFEENLIEKNNRRVFTKKKFTPFIHSNLYEIKNTYAVEKHRSFSKEETEFLKKSENIKLALKYGQEISIEQSTGELLMTYPIFPILMTDILFEGSVRNYFIPPDLKSEIESINVDLISKSHLGTISLLQSDMENYVYLCWIQLWATTFWYHKKEEAKYRFQQLLKVLDRVINHEMEIFNLLFESLSKYGEDYMVLKLYERLIYYKLNPSYSIRTIVTNIDKKETIGFNNIIKQLQKYDFNQTYETRKFKKRGFKTKQDGNVITEKVVFYPWDTCEDCQTEINFECISRDFKKMRRDVFWAVCSCGANFLPKIGVKIGVELNTLDKVKFNTSSFHPFVLHSPYYLKYNYTTGLLNEYGIKMHVEGFRTRFNAIFWGSIWYFNIKGLDYDFFLPYLSDSSENIPLLKNKSSIKINKVERFSKSEINQILNKRRDTSSVKDELFEARSLIHHNTVTMKKINEKLRLSYITTDLTIQQKASDFELKSNLNYTRGIKHRKSCINLPTLNLKQITSNNPINLRTGLSLREVIIPDSGENTNRYGITYKESDEEILDIGNFKQIDTEINQSVLVTEQSFVNPNNLYDSSTVYEYSRVESDYDIESIRGYRKLGKDLNTIQEDVEELVNLAEPVSDRKSRFTCNKIELEIEIENENITTTNNILVSANSPSNKETVTPVQSPSIINSKDIIKIFREHFGKSNSLRKRSYETNRDINSIYDADFSKSEKYEKNPTTRYKNISSLNTRNTFTIEVARENVNIN